MKNPKDYLLPGYDYTDMFVREIVKIETLNWDVRNELERYRKFLSYADYMTMVKRFEHIDDYLKHTRLAMCDVKFIEPNIHEIHHDNRCNGNAQDLGK